jgi:alpha-N-arabinofuranosidase
MAKKLSLLDISLAVNDAKHSSVTGKIITSKTLQDHNSFDEPGKIWPAVFNNATISNNGLQVKLPPFSVVVLTLK